MTSRKRHNSTSSSVNARRNRQPSSRKSRRQRLLETLEPRQLLAGPQLIGIQPNEGALIENGTVRDTAPRVITFGFDEDQKIDTATFDGIRLTRAGDDGEFETADDVEITPGLVTLGDPNENEVVVRFAEGLPDDNYRIEVFGFDDDGLGVVGLRNRDGDLFMPSDPTKRSEVVEFELRLGALVEAVVPQPVIRQDDGSLTQNRNEIVVYFNEDELFVEDDENGDPTFRSAENTRFYQLLFTQETVRTTDDLRFHPDEVVYDAETHTARLIFAGDDINDLPGVPLGGGSWRLRVGTAVDERVDLILPPTEVPVAASAVTDFQYDSLRVSFFSLAIGEGGSGRGVRFEDVGNAPAMTASLDADGTVVFNFAGTTAVVSDLRDAIIASPAVSAVIDVTWERDGTPGAGAGLALPRNIIGAPPLTLQAVGDTLETALDVGIFGRSADITSIILAESIDPQDFDIELPGGNDDPGHRELPETIRDLIHHINSNFGADTQDGITEIPYNFKGIFDTDFQGNNFLNQITERQKLRVREALNLWSEKIGVQFIETQNTGITFAVGDVDNLQFVPGTRLSSQSALDASVRIDPDFVDSAIVFSNQATFGTAYGEDFTRKATAGIGLLLGLETTPDLPAQTLMAFDFGFLNAPIDALLDLEPVFPGNYDVLHGQYVHRPDSIDIDMYRFEVDLDDADKRGTLTAETFAERLPDSSLLDTTLTLFQEVNASIIADFGIGATLGVNIEAMAPGRLGNNARIDFIQTDRFSPTDDDIRISPQFDSEGNRIANSVLIDLPRRGTFIDSVPVSDVIEAINADPFASSIFRATLVTGEASTDISGRPTPLPLLLRGGGVFQLSRNDDYFSEDSRIVASLGEGVYFVGIAASGNDTYDPTIPGSGFGGRTQGDYELHLKFEPQVDEVDVIRDLDNDRVDVPGTPLDGDGDGVPGGVHNFWFQTRPLNRTLNFTDNGVAITAGQTIRLVGSSGVTRTFEFVPIGSNPRPGNVPVPYNDGTTGFPTPPGNLAAALQTAVNSRRNETGISASRLGSNVVLTGERTIEFSSDFRGADALGRNIFVDKIAGPQADGSLERPFNNITNPVVANAFGSAIAGDIVRIVGNGGQDQDITTEPDNFAYQIGIPDTGGGSLVDGRVMEVPKGVTTMIDAGAAFKIRGSYIGVGSSTLQVDRSNGALQVLGTPRLVQLSKAGDPIATSLIGGANVDTPGYDDGSVIFTSTRDRAVDADASGISPAAEPGDWGGIIFRRDLDQFEGRRDLEDEGIFLQRVNHAEFRYGGSSNILIDSVQQLVNPIQLINLRPTITFNEITESADAAISAAPNSFEETSFQAPKFQQGGAFTADYDRVGPEIRNNQLVDNSVNGLFIRVATTPVDPPKALTVAGRLDDIDVVHYLPENLVVEGSPGGAIVDGFAPSTVLISGQQRAGGTLGAGTYLYKMTFVDADGFESAPSADTFTFDVSADDSSVELTALPQVQADTDYVSRRLYRAEASATPEFNLIAELDASSDTYLDNGSQTEGLLDLNRLGIRGRLDGSLVADPGLVFKLSGARIELGQGTQLLAEGLGSNPVIFSSILDDRFGAGGTFDTNNDNDSFGGAEPARLSDWAGIYAGPNSNVSLDHAVVAYGGGISLIEGGETRGFVPLQLQQAEGRITNSRFEFNDDGQDGAGRIGRFGRLAVAPSTIFVRGSEPIIVGNTFVDNLGTIIDIDSDSMDGDLRIDIGRQTGDNDRFSELDDNHGPLIRFNRYRDNEITGLEIRGGTLTTESVWDDTDIVHLLFDGIVVDNFHSDGGLRLKSRPDESLVVKLTGPGTPNSPTVGTGLTATGTPNDVEDRIGGSVHVIGLPGAPVVLTSFKDDTVGAGLKPDGSQFTDNNGDGIGSRPESNDWRSILLDQYSVDRNVDLIPESELSTEVAPGLNSTIENAQFLGELAAELTASDEVLRLGFEVEGFLSGPTDVDVYSFTGSPGTEIWVDIDRTSYTLDTVIELLDENGTVLARSDNSFDEVANGSDVTVLDSRLEGITTSLQARDDRYTDFGAGGLYEDFGSVNPRDAGIHFTLTGNSADPESRSAYFFRVRSDSVNPDDAAGGLTRGGYRFQVRLSEDQEFPGSIVRYTDIRFANHGVHIRGLPGSSPLLGEAYENEAYDQFDAQNDQIQNSNAAGTDVTPLGQRPQWLGNLVGNKAGVISVGGVLDTGSDVDFYQFDVDYMGVAGVAQSTILDIDYADGFNRPDTNVSVFFDPDGETLNGEPFNEQARLVLYGKASNILDDLTSPNGENSELEKLIRGSISSGDPFIGPVILPEGTYYVAVTEDEVEPAEFTSNPFLRREPINSVQRIVEDRIDTTSTPSTASGPLLPEFFTDAAIVASDFQQVLETSPGHGKPGHFDGTNTPLAPFDGTYFETTEYGDAPESIPSADLELLEWSLTDRADIGGEFTGSIFFGGQSINTSTLFPHVSIEGDIGGDRADFYQFEVADDNSTVILDIDNGFDPFDEDPGSVDTDMVLIRANPAGPGFQFVPTTGRITGSEPEDGRSGTLWDGFSTLTDDPFVEITLDAGVYFVGILQSQVGFAFSNTGFPVLGDQDPIGGPLDYTLHVSVEGHEVPSLVGNEVLHFDRTAFIPMGTLTSEPFDLTGYVAADLPTMYFNYRYDPEIGDFVTLRVFSDQNPAGETIGSGFVTGDVGFVPDNTWRQMRVTLEDFAGDTNIRAEFVYTASGVSNFGSQGLFLDDFVIGFAERGETVFGARGGEDGFTGFGTGFGEYQLEIRPGTDYALPTAFGQQLVEDFDTNDRHSQSITIVAPAGSQIVDGDTFVIGDGAANETFEFTTTPGTVAFGNTQVVYSPADTPAQVAEAIRTAIGQQTSIKIEASSASGLDTQSMDDARLSLSGRARGTFQPIDSVADAPMTLMSDSDGNLLLPAILHNGVGDENFLRTQGQVIVDANTIRDAHAVGIWSEPGSRDGDPDDVRYGVPGGLFFNFFPFFPFFNPFFGFGFGARSLFDHPFLELPPIGNTYPGAVRNLPTLNDEVLGGLTPGVVVTNNTVDQAGYAGVKVDGEARPWMIEMNETDGFLTGANTIHDGSLMVIDAANTRVIFEFEDISGDATTDNGSGVLGGNGYGAQHVPIYYRKDCACTYNNRSLTNDPSRGFIDGTNDYESIEIATAIHQAIQGSILVTNDLVELVTATIGPSLDRLSEPAELAALNEMAFPNAAVYVQGASNIFFLGNTGTMQVQQAPVYEAPQPFARLVNNTIIGEDGRETHFPEPGNLEPNDIIENAIDTKVAKSRRPYIDDGVIGDNFGPVPMSGDVDFYRVALGVGDRLIVDIDTLDEDLANGVPEGPDTILQIFDEKGNVQPFLDSQGNVVFMSDNDTAPAYLDPLSTINTPVNDVINNPDPANPGGSLDPRDPFVDFTALSTGTYYIAVSSAGNQDFDPNAVSGREEASGGTGAYTIGIQNYAPRTSVLSLLGPDNGDGGGDMNGDRFVGTTFTITQIPDIAPNRLTDSTPGAPNTVTFEFANSGALRLGNGNYAVNVGSPTGDVENWTPDIMRAISDAINRNPELRNHENNNGPDPFLLDEDAQPNQNPISGPISRVRAQALGGIDGDFLEYPNLTRQGMPIIMVHANQSGPRPVTGPTDFQRGFGHDRTLSSGDGTTEQFVLIENAAEVEISPQAAARGLSLDPLPDQDTDQLINEAGVVIAGGASPALLNNVFLNLHESVVREETWISPAFGFTPESLDLQIKPMEMVVVASVFQNDEPALTTFNEFIGSGITTGVNEPSNVNGGIDDFNITLNPSDPTLQFSFGDNYLPVGNSVLVDSSINSLIERDAFAGLKASVGIPVSNILAPIRDVAGILRADNPNFPNLGIGGSVFKDRGSNELADFVGPVAIAEIPRDNDAEGVDEDPVVSFINLSEGVFDEFRIQLRDNGDASDPFAGIGIDDTTVVLPEIPGIRAAGSNITLFEDERLLVEGIDYTFNFDETKKIITLNPLAGIWKNDRSYRIALNNRDRTALIAPDPSELDDGDQLEITDTLGGTVVFEFESGFQLLVPEPITMVVPRAGTTAGGLSDGDIFQVSDGQNPTVVFEFNSDIAKLPGTVEVPLPTTPTPSDEVELAAFLNAIAQDIAAAIQGEIDAGRLNADVRVIGNEVVVGTEPSATVQTSGSGLLQEPRTLGLNVPASGTDIAGVNPGETFEVSNGLLTVNFQFTDTNNPVIPGNVAVDITEPVDPVNGLPIPLTADEVATAIFDAVLTTELELEPAIIGRTVYLGLPLAGSATVPGGQLTVVGVSRTPTDGDTVVFTPDDGTADVVFEINRTDEPDPDGVPMNDGVTDPNVPVDVNRATTANEFAALLSSAIRAEVISGLNPNDVQVIDGGLVTIGGQQGLGLAVTGTSLEVVGSPDVTGASTIEVFGPLILNMPIVGGGGVRDGDVLIIKDDLGNDVFFEFDFDGNFNVVGSIPIIYNSFDDVQTLTTNVVAVINTAAIGINASDLGNGKISLGRIDESRVNTEGIPALGIPGTPQITAQRGIVNDGEILTIRQGTTSVSYEFESIVGGGGVGQNNIAVAFQPGSTPGDVAVSLAAAINNNLGGLRLFAQAEEDENGVPNGRVNLNDLPGTVVDRSQAPTLNLLGVPGGAIPVRISPAFSDVEVKQALLFALNSVNQPGELPVTTLAAQDRGGATLFVENGRIFNGPLENFFLTGIKDLAGNALEANREDFSTQFTILMPTVGLDFGDAPDPVGLVAGRYETLLIDDGARHVSGDLRLGSLIDADVDGLAVPNADGDDLTIAISEEGLIFETSLSGGVAEISISEIIDPTSRDGDTITIDTGVALATLELDLDGRFDEDNFAIRPIDPSSDSSIAAAIVEAIDESPLNPAGVVVSDGSVLVIADDEDGVDFSSETNPNGVLNKGVQTPISVTVTGGGILEAWVDFNADGDWDDPGEQIINGLTPGALFSDVGAPVTRVFNVTVPQVAPDPPVPLDTYARFRVSREGNLQPNGLALSGEVEDYIVKILPGGPPTIGPTAANRTFTVNENPAVLQALDANGTLTFTTNDDGLLEGVVDPQGDPIAIIPQDVGIRTLMTPAGTTAGTLDLASDGTFTFNPEDNFNGVATFTARVTDLNPLNPDAQIVSSTPISVTISVEPVNDPPVADPPVVINREIDEDEVQIFDKTELIDPFYTPGPENEMDQPLIFESVGSFRGSTFLPFLTSLNGTVAIINDGTAIEYTPPVDYNGDTPDTFTYVVADVPPEGQLSQPSSTVGTVSITFNEVNDPPRVTNDTYDTDEDVVLTIPINGPVAGLPGILDNDRPGPPNPPDQFEEDQEIRLLDPANQFPKETFRGGEVRFENGALVYAPPLRFSGIDQFEYTVEDSLFATSTGTVSVIVGGINNEPDFVGPESLEYNEAKESPQEVQIDLTTWFIDPESDPMTFAVSSDNPSVVAARLVGDLMILELQPFAFGTVNLTVTATDDTGASRAVMVPVMVNNTPDPPSVIDTLDPASGTEDQLFVADLSTIFADPDGQQLDYSVARLDNVINPTPDQIAQHPLVRSITFVGDSMRITLQPDQSGEVEIEIGAADDFFRVSDSFTLTVTPVPDGPTAIGDAYAVPVGATLQILNPTSGLLRNDFDPDGDEIRVDQASVTDTQLGDLTLSDDGTFTYTNTDGNVNDIDSFSYRLIDSTGRRSAPVIVTLTLNQSRYQNPIQEDFGDVTADGVVSALDALRILNLLNRRLDGSQPFLPVSEIGAPPPDYVDVNGDGRVSSIDALLVINILAQRGTTGGEAELVSASDQGVTTAYAAPVTAALPTANFAAPLADDESETEVTTIDETQARDALLTVGMSISQASSEIAADSIVASEQAASEEDVDEVLSSVLDDLSL